MCPRTNTDQFCAVKIETFLVKNSWVGNGDTLLRDCYYSLYPNCSFLFLVGFPTPWYITTYQPALPSPMLLQCHTHFALPKQGGLFRLQNQPKPWPCPPIPASAGHRLRRSCRSEAWEQAGRAMLPFREHVQAKHCMYYAHKALSPCAKPAMKGWIF